MAAKRRSSSVAKYDFFADPGFIHGFSADAAWKIAMAPGGSQSVIALEGGGFGEPLRPSELVKRRSGDRLIAQVPRGLVNVVFTGSAWRATGDVHSPGKRISAQLDHEIGAALSSRKRR
jgi:hypothetical protein